MPRPVDVDFTRVISQKAVSGQVDNTREVRLHVHLQFRSPSQTCFSGVCFEPSVSVSISHDPRRNILDADGGKLSVAATWLRSGTYSVRLKRSLAFD